MKAYQKKIKTIHFNCNRDTSYWISAWKCRKNVISSAFRGDVGSQINEFFRLSLIKRRYLDHGTPPILFILYQTFHFQLFWSNSSFFTKASFFSLCFNHETWNHWVIREGCEQKLWTLQLISYSDENHRRLINVFLWVSLFIFLSYPWWYVYE